MKVWLGRMAAVTFWLTASTTLAEPVFVNAGNQKVGQGWAFGNRGQCYVVTAYHVVNGPGLPFVVSATGRTGQALPPSPKRSPFQDEHGIFHPAGLDPPDIGIFAVTGGIANPCPTSSIGDVNDALIVRAQERNENLQYVRVQVPQDDPRDAKGQDFPRLKVVSISTNWRFALANEGVGMQIQQSASGGPILYNGEGVLEQKVFVGVAFSVRGDDIQAVRGDIIRKFFENAVVPYQSTTAALPRTLVRFEGTVEDVRCGPQNLTLVDAPCGWKVAKAGSSEIELDLGLGDAPVVVTAVEVDFAESAGVRGISILTSENSHVADLVGERYCHIEQNAQTVVCSMGDREARLLAVRVDAARTEIRHIKILSGH